MRIRSDSNGFTLIELMIYMALVGMVFVVVGGLLVNALQTQKTVRSASHAINTGQLVLDSIEASVRNGSGMEVADAGTLLVVRIPSGTSWACRAWFFDPTDDGSVYMTTQPDRSAITTASASSNWTLLAEDAGASLTEIFAPLTIGSPTGNPVTVNLNMRIDGQPPVALSTTTAPRLFSSDPGTCF